MKKRTVELAEQLLKSVPQDEMRDLIRMLSYYNSTFPEADRYRYFVTGSVSPKDPALEREVQQERSSKTAGSQNVYFVSTTGVCKCCGR
jgi:hypothetical protein